MLIKTMTLGNGCVWASNSASTTTITTERNWLQNYPVNTLQVTINKTTTSNCHRTACLAHNWNVDVILRNKLVHNNALGIKKWARIWIDDAKLKIAESVAIDNKKTQFPLHIHWLPLIT